jgi:hypothetical protein
MEILVMSMKKHFFNSEIGYDYYIELNEDIKLYHNIEVYKILEYKVTKGLKKGINIKKSDHIWIDYIFEIILSSY